MNEDLRSLVTGPQAEFRSHDYPALLTALSFEDASLSSAAMRSRGANQYLKTKDDHVVGVEEPQSNEC